jgi:hypothetical protein
MTTIQRLQQWYAAHCNGLWEHTYGVDIGTLDNPGWSVKIALIGTDLESRAMARIERLDGEDWIVCHRTDGYFEAAGGAGNLEEILSVFLSWAR